MMVFLTKFETDIERVVQINQFTNVVLSYFGHFLIEYLKWEPIHLVPCIWGTEY